MKPFNKETAHLHPDVVEKFWARVMVSQNVKDCWEWTGRFDTPSRSQGTWTPARFDVQKNKVRIAMRAHRFSWAIVHGYPGKLEIRRDCNNCACVNPDHMSIGTRNDTIDAMIARGTTAKGNSHAKQHDHAGIYADHVAGMSYKDIMKKHNISSKGTVSFIIKKSKEVNEWK